MHNVYSVGQVNRYIKNMFTQDFFLQRIYVKGEVSNCKYHTSGHLYFSLKDETGSISCVMFAGARRGLAFRMKDGDKIVAGGSVDIYERDGRYQLYVREITLEGAGALYERYLALKQELEDMGMFAAEYKQPIPRYIRRLGVVTAPTGAAVQDIRNVSLRRNPYLQIILYPALVQGEGAAESIAKGIRMLDAAGVDVIIAGRGGGSIEDLWAFNEGHFRRRARDGLYHRGFCGGSSRSHAFRGGGTGSGRLCGSSGFHFKRETQDASCHDRKNTAGPGKGPVVSAETPVPEPRKQAAGGPAASG